MYLTDILQQIPVAVINQPRLEGVRVNGVRLDSRAVTPGDLFVALTGGNTDGHRFIPDAVRRGAAAVIGTREPEDLPVPYLQVADSRQALAYFSAALYGFPSRQLTVIGVTGTDGKTTTSNILFSILKSAGLKAGMISTVNALIGDQALDTGFHVTTPEAPDVQRYLALMVQAGLTHVVLESTSHGLAQHRVTACEYDIGVVTNITHEHLDYHGSYEAYRAAKARMFEMLAEPKKKTRPVEALAVLNHDDRSYEFLHDLVRVRQIAYGLSHDGCELWAEEVRHTPDEMTFFVCARDFRAPVRTRLAGEYNVSNILAAFGAAVFGLGIALQDAARGVASLPGVPGRMERIALGQDFTAIVDFAHTPNALKNALETVRRMTAGRVIAVFGSAGLRDRQKRRMMAEVSAKLADITILTAEDPRTESLEAILAEMAAAAEGCGAREGETFFRVPDRGEAIRLGLRLARPGDLVVACGKGHEQSMCFGEVEYPWDDRTAVRAALSELLGLPGPEMPYLPTRDPR